MSQVPYTPVPSVSPVTPLPGGIHVDTPPAAFGTNIAQAVEGVGRQLEQGGNELFQRAVALQQLRNETEAKEADAQYMIGVGQRHAQFSALEGKNAVDAFPKYVADVQAMRQQYRDGLSNDMARRMFDSSSLSTMSRTVFNGAGHAAMQNKAWANGAADARIQAAAAMAATNYKDEGAFQDALKVNYDATATKAQLHGWDPAQFSDELNKENSKLYAKKIDGWRQYDPFAAGKYMEDNRTKLGLLYPEVERRVRDSQNTVGARNLAHNLVYGENVSYGTGVVSMDRAKAAISAVESGGDYENITDSKTRHGAALGKYQIMEDELQGDLARANLPSMTPQEFLKDHAAQEQVFEVKFGSDMQKYGSFNEAAARWIGLGAAGDRFGTTWQRYLVKTNAELAKTASLQDKEDIVRKQAAEVSPDPLLPDYAANQVNIMHNHQIATQKDEEFRNRNTIEGAMMGGPDGKLPSSVEELTANPEVRAAWDRLGAARDGQIQQRHYIQQLAKIAKGDTALTEQGLRRWNELIGMRQSDPNEFLGVDIIDENLPISTKKELLKMQQDVNKVPDQDPKVTRALNILRGDMDAAGLSRTAGADKEAYDNFVGVLTKTLQDYQTEHHQQPKMDEVRTMGARLLQQQSTPHWYSPWSTTPTFQVPVPDEAAEIIKADPYWVKQGIVPDNRMIQEIYAAQQYKKLYGGSVSQPKPAAPSAGQVQ